jgi:hypothetical protein
MVDEEGTVADVGKISEGEGRTKRCRGERWFPRP